MSREKYLFIDRDGCLIEEPADFQIDSIEKFKLMPLVIPSLLKLKEAGYTFVMVSNQDGLGTPGYPQEKFDLVQKILMDILNTQGIQFSEILICPHFDREQCNCRKPKVELVMNYLSNPHWDRKNSYVIGDRQTDMELAKNMGIAGLRVGADLKWNDIALALTTNPRKGECHRKTKETNIDVLVNLDQAGPHQISTGIGFFDHMLDQVATHAGFQLRLNAQGDLVIDDHHTVEDVGIALGVAMKEALGDKRGIGRFGFTLPMDEAQCTIALDLSGRSFFSFEGSFNRSDVGGLNTEMVPHFLRSFSESLGATLHVTMQGVNTHHQVEVIFKCLGRALRQAIKKEQNSNELPSTKGQL